MAKKLIVGNWKMNLGPHQAGLLVSRLSDKITVHPGVTVVLCPPFVDLHPLAKEIKADKLKLGAQNVHYRDEGAYTGEISPAMLSGLAQYVIVGHSERRAQFGEDDKLIALKLAAAVRHDLKPILCVGENLLDHQHGLSQKVVIDQLTADLAMVTAEDMHGLAVAYEPVWAIGTGNFARPDDVAPIVSAIKQTVEELYGEAAGMNVQVLYGGSVDEHNASAYLTLPGVDGLLVGGASLNPEQFGAIVTAATKASQS